MAPTTLIEEAYTVSVGERVRELREKQGLSIAELARRSDLTRNGLSRVELGARTPSSVTVEKIAAGLNVDPGELFPKELAPHSLEERRFAEVTLEPWISHLEYRAWVWVRHTARPPEKNPYLTSWQVALRWG